MVRIRQQQIDAFIEARISDFVTDLCTRLRAEMVTESDLSDFVRKGVERAREFGIESAEAVEGFVRIQLALGADFDQDPRYPWAAEILKSDTEIDTVKVWLLTQSAEKMTA